MRQNNEIRSVEEDSLELLQGFSRHVVEQLDIASAKEVSSFTVATLKRFFRFFLTLLLGFSLGGSLQGEEEASPEISLEVWQNGVRLAVGTEISGVIEVRGTVAQGGEVTPRFFQNLRMIKDFSASYVFGETEAWAFRIEVDTTTMLDGENLLSLQLWPRPTASGPRAVDLVFAAYTIVTANGNIPERGDYGLPQAAFNDAKVKVDRNGMVQPWIDFLRAAFTIEDDLGEVSFSSALYHSRWSLFLGDVSLPPAVFDGSPDPYVSDRASTSWIDLRPFQTSESRPACMVLFFSNASGRANYAVQSVEIPALDPSTDPALRNLPSAEILNVAAGDSLTIAAGGEWALRARVSNVNLAALDQVPLLSLWAGHQLLSWRKLAPLLETSGVPSDSFEVELGVDASEVEGRTNLLWETPDRFGGELSLQVMSPSPFGTSLLPVSSAIPLKVLASSDMVASIGTPGLRLAVERSDFSGHGFRTFRAVVDGAETENLLVGYTVDDGPVIWLSQDEAESFSVTFVESGTHHVEVFLATSEKERLSNPDAVQAVQVEVDSLRSFGFEDLYFGVVDETIVRSAASGVLMNDRTERTKPLFAELSTPPEAGSLDFSADGSFVYTPSPGFIGIDSFTYVLLDGAQRSLPVRVRIFVESAGARSTLGQSVSRYQAFPRNPSRLIHPVGWGNSRPLWETEPLHRVWDWEGPLSVVNGLLLGRQGGFSSSQQVAAFDLESGVQSWTWSAASAGSYGLESSARLLFRGNEFLVAASDRDRVPFLFAVDLEDGTTAWQRRIQNTRFGIENTFEASDAGTVLIHHVSSLLSGYDSDRERVVWMADERTEDASFTRYGDRIYARKGTVLFELNAKTGEMLREVDLGFSGIMLPSLEGPFLLFADSDRATSQSRFTCVDLESFKIRWQTWGRTYFVSSLTSFQDRLFLPESTEPFGEMTQLAEIDLLTGTVLRRLVAEKPFTSPPLIAPNAIVLQTESELRIFDRDTFTLQKTLPVNGPIVLAGDFLATIDLDEDVVRTWRLYPDDNYTLSLSENVAERGEVSLIGTRKAGSRMNGQVTASPGFAVASVLIGEEVLYEGTPAPEVDIGFWLERPSETLSVNYVYGPDSTLEHVRILPAEATEDAKIRVFLRADFRYQVEQSDDLLTWRPFLSPRSGSDSFEEWPTPGAGFYRIVEMGPE
jgi:hypothetical protein